MENETYALDEVVVPKSRNTINLTKVIIRARNTSGIIPQGNDLKITTKYITNILESVKAFQKYNHSRILVTDDEEFCLSSIQAIMRSIGIDVENRVDVCINGKEAIN